MTASHSAGEKIVVKLYYARLIFTVFILYVFYGKYVVRNVSFRISYEFRS